MNKDRTAQVASVTEWARPTAEITGAAARDGDRPSRAVFCPAWPVLSPATFFAEAAHEAPYPLNAPVRRSFYLARSAIYHLFRNLRLGPDEAVLVPDYHSGNEVSAIRAAGARIRFYSIGQDLQPDMDQLSRLSAGARVLYAIHFVGWPQPIEEFADLCERRGMLLVEDCALALLSESGGRPLGTWGDYSIYCLYKTLPVPNGGLLVQNRNMLESFHTPPMRAPGRLSVAGRNAELIVAWLRGRSEMAGRAVFGLKSVVGRALTSLRVRRVPVGDIGFDRGHLNLAMSRSSDRLLPRLDYAGIRRRRRANYLRMHRLLDGSARPLCPELPEGVCPLFYPVLVKKKHEAAEALRARGIQAVELWNRGDPEVPRENSGDAQYLREHVLELPIHQSITDAQVDYIAGMVRRLGL